MIALVGDVFEQIAPHNLDGLLNAANCIGPMGRGIAGAIRAHGGDEIVSDAYRACGRLRPKPGGAYSTTSGHLVFLGVKRIIHACTMYQPAGPTSVEVCGRAFLAALHLAEDQEITRLGCTALGTGVGRLDPVKVADAMVGSYNQYLQQAQNKVEVVFCDRNALFINRLLEIYA